MLGLGHKKNIFVLSIHRWGQTIAKFENTPSLTCAGCSGEARITGDSQPKNSFKLHAARPETLVEFNF